jgi:hypothetical protein
MIDLYKLDGTLKPRAKMLYDFRAVKVAEAKEAWLKEQRVAYELAHPSFEMVTDDDSVETRVELEQAITFEEYLAETLVVQEAVEATYDENDIELTPAILEESLPVREFEEPEILEADFDAYLIQKYADLRGASYDSLGAQLDRITKALKFLQTAGVDIGLDGEAQVLMADEVKATYPKA